MTLRSRLRPSLALTGLLAVAALGLAGCASGDAGTGSADGTSGTPAAATSLSDVKAKGELVIGTEGTYSPFSFHEGSGSGALTGYDVEVATAVADKLGVKPVFEETQFDGIFAGLEAGRWDVIANQISITDERKTVYDFSEPYTVSPGVIIVKGSDSGISSFADLAGKTTAQSLTSNWNELATQSGAKVEAVEGFAQAVTLLQQGRVDATINDPPHAPRLPEAAGRLRPAGRRGDRRPVAQRAPLPQGQRRPRDRGRPGSRGPARRRHARVDLREVLRRGRLAVDRRVR